MKKSEVKSKIRKVFKSPPESGKVNVNSQKVSGFKSKTVKVKSKTYKSIQKKLMRVHNSYAIVIPMSIIKKCQIIEGMEFEVGTDGESLVLVPVKQDKQGNRIKRLWV